MKLAEDFVAIGELFSKHVSKARDIFTMKKIFALLSQHAPDDNKWDS